MTNPPDELIPTRETLWRISAHVLGRRRFQVCGRFGLRTSPGGIATPAYGDAPEVLRVSGTTLVREVGALALHREIPGSTLSELAEFAEADLRAPFDCGRDAPALGDVDAPLHVDAPAVRVLADWYAFGWKVIDAAVAELPASAEPAVIQLWPEHFDAGTNLALIPDVHVNIGASPGDSFEQQPYLYVGPWDSSRPGGTDYWNAPFGAVLRWSDVGASVEPEAMARHFLRKGLRLLAGP